MDSNKLIEAVRENRLDVVQAFVAGCPSALAHTVDCLGHTLVHLAAMHGQRDVAELLLTMGADASASSTEGKTPLHFACQLGDLKMAELLVSHGANLNALDAFQMTPLHWAVEKNHVDIVRLLCQQRGVDVNLADRQGRTCVAIANKRGNNCLLEILNKKLCELRLQGDTDPALWPSAASKALPRPVFDSNTIPTNPFGKRKSYAKSIPVNCRANYPVIVTAPPPPSEQVTAPKPPSVVMNKNKVRIDVLDESSSDEEASCCHGAHRRSREHHLGAQTKKRQLSFSPNTVLDDTLYWLKRQALANSSSDLSTDFCLGGRELSLTEAGRLALKYLNENDSIQSEKSLFIKLAKSYEQESNEEMARSPSSSSLNSTSGLDALVNAMDQQFEDLTSLDDTAYRSQLVRSDFFTGLNENPADSLTVLNGLLKDSEASPSSSQPNTSEPLNLLDLNLLTDELNLDDCV